MLSAPADTSKQKDVKDFGLLLKSMLEPETTLADKTVWELCRPEATDPEACDLHAQTGEKEVQELLKVRLPFQSRRPGADSIHAACVPPKSSRSRVSRELRIPNATS